MIQKNKILILWSGGIDSTAVLKWYLENTDIEVVAMKIEYITLSISTQRISKEMEAISKLLPKLQKIRTFRFELMKVNIPNYASGGDVLQFGTLSILPAHGFGCEEIVISFTSDYRDANHKTVDKQLIRLNDISRILTEGNKNIWKFQPKFILNPFYNPKYIYIKYLGEMVVDTWFCRNPWDSDNLNGCGECDSCLHVKRSIPQLINI